MGSVENSNMSDDAVNPFLEQDVEDGCKREVKDVWKFYRGADQLLIVRKRKRAKREKGVSLAPVVERREVRQTLMIQLLTVNC